MRGVYRPERRRRQGGQDGRMLGHRLRYALATDQAGEDELVRVVAVHLRARRTHAFTPIPAWDQHVPQRVVVGVVAVEHFAGLGVDHRTTTAHPDRVSTAAGGPDLLFPGGVVRHLGTPQHRPNVLGQV